MIYLSLVVDLDSFDTKQQRAELLALRAKRAKKIKATQAFQVIIGLFAVIGLLVLLFRVKGEGDPIWKERIEVAVLDQTEWLASHGLGIEKQTFESLKNSVGSFISFFGDGAFTSILFELGRLFLISGFFIIASFRLLLIGAVLGYTTGFYSKTPHAGFDLLGESGIGRLFFSGIKVSKEDLEVGKLIPGMVTLKRGSEIGALEEVFEAYKVRSKTAHDLALIVKAYEDWPDGRGTLFETTKITLAEVLSIKTGNQIYQPNLSIQSFLTRKMKQDIEAVSSDILAVLVLALKAGQILTFDKSGQQLSKFPQLNARAVLHSIPFYSEEFSLSERTAIRRAIIYASRESLLAPVRFPSDLTPITVALRQISEVLVSKSPETELFGLVYEAHKLFEEKFEKSRLNEAYLSDSVLLVPVKEIVRILRTAIPEIERRRIIELASIDRSDKVDLKGDVVSENEGLVVKSNLIIPKPLTTRGVSDLSGSHKVGLEDLSEWLGLRSVLLSFGWLARRVGESLVPDTSIVNCSFLNKENPIFGLIPLRRSRVGLNLDYPFVESPRIDG